MVVTYAQEALCARDEIFEIARAVYRGEMPPLRLGFSSFIQPNLIQKFRTSYVSMFPSCEVHLSGDDRANILERLEHGGLDGAFLSMPIDGTDWIVREVSRDPLVVCMRTDDLMARERDISLSLLETTLKIFRAPQTHPSAHNRLIELLLEVGISPVISYSASTPADIQWMVRAGDGVALVDQTSLVDSDLTTRPIAGVRWTADTAFVHHIEAGHPVRQELKSHGVVDKTDHQFKVLISRSEMTGADRRCASQYELGDVLRYQRGSKQFGLERGSYAEVIAVDAKSNFIRVQKDTGDVVSYDPARVCGIDAYRETEKSFAVGDRLQMTAPYRDLDLPNRALGTVEQIVKRELTVRMDSGRTVAFDPQEMRHFDHGHAVTSHSSQGLTAERVLVNMDTEMHSNLINARFAYVSISRGSHAAQIFTDNAAALNECLGHDVSKASAMNFTQEGKPKEPMIHDQSFTRQAAIVAQLSI